MIALGQRINPQIDWQRHPALAGCWAADDGAGPNVRDRSGRNQHGSFPGAWAPGLGQPALALAGSGSDVLSIPDSSLLQPTRVTVMLWFWLGSVPGSAMTLASKPRTTTPWSSPYTSWLIRINSSTLIEYGISLASYTGTTATVTTLVTGRWYHVAITHDGFTRRGFFNGIEVVTANQTGTIGYGAYPVLFGADNSSSPYGELLNGRIAQARIYTRALRPEEIREAYQHPPNVFLPDRSRYGSGVNLTRDLSDGLSFGEVRASGPAKPFSDLLTYLSESLMSCPGLSWSENVAPSDAMTRLAAFERVWYEALPILESLPILCATELGKSEALGLTDSIADRALGRAFVEAVSLLDVLAKLAELPKSESALGLADAGVRGPNKAPLDPIGLADARATVTTFTRNYADGLALLSVLATAPTKTFADPVTVADLVLYAMASPQWKALADALNLQETLLPNWGKSLGETFAWTEAGGPFTAGKRLSEPINALDLLAPSLGYGLARSFLETVPVADQVAKLYAKIGGAEAWAFADALARTARTSAADSFAFADLATGALAATLARALADPVNLGEAGSRRPARVGSDALAAADALAGAWAGYRALYDQLPVADQFALALHLVRAYADALNLGSAAAGATFNAIAALILQGRRRPAAVAFRAPRVASLFTAPRAEGQFRAPRARSLVQSARAHCHLVWGPAAGRLLWDEAGQYFLDENGVPIAIDP